MDSNYFGGGGGRIRDSQSNVVLSLEITRSEMLTERGLKQGWCCFEFSQQIISICHYSKPANNIKFTFNFLMHFSFSLKEIVY